LTVEREIEIVNRLGLHARAAARFVTTANAYDSEIRLHRDGKTVNGKSIMGVMMLAAAKGTRLLLEVTGEDEEAAADALCRLVRSRFGEED